MSMMVRYVLLALESIPTGLGTPEVPVAVAETCSISSCCHEHRSKLIFTAFDRCSRPEKLTFYLIFFHTTEQLRVRGLVYEPSSGSLVDLGNSQPSDQQSNAINTKAE